MPFVIGSDRKMFRDFIRTYEALRRGRRVAPSEDVGFTSLEAARNFLTPKRVALLRLIKEHEPGSIYRLAKLARRGFPGVLRDVELLKRHGLLALERRKEAGRRSVAPSVRYDAIQLSIGI